RARRSPAQRWAAEEGRGRGGRREGRAPCGPVGRGQGSPGPAGLESVGRSAAAVVHRARDRRRAGRPVDGRAVLRAGSDLDERDRRSEEHTSELQSREKLVFHILLERNNRKKYLT